MTPGPAHKVFALRSTRQFDNQLQAWKRIEHKVEWQRLADPHEHFAGGKVRAIMLFDCSRCGFGCPGGRPPGRHRSVCVSMSPRRVQSRG